MRALWLVPVILLGPWSPVGAAGGSKAAAPLTTDGVRVREVSLGDLVADAVLQAGHAQVALLPATQFKPGTIAPGRVTVANVVALLVKPDRQWVVSNLTGAGLKAALERSLSRAPDECAYLLQVAGVRVEYDRKAPPGRRITRLTLGGAEVSDAMVYQVALTEDLAKGGSGFFVVPDFNGKNIRTDANGRPTPSGTLETAVAAWLDATPELRYGAPDRILASTP